MFIKFVHSLIKNYLKNSKRSITNRIKIVDEINCLGCAQKKYEIIKRTYLYA